MSIKNTEEFLTWLDKEINSRRAVSFDSSRNEITRNANDLTANALQVVKSKFIELNDPITK